MKYIIDQKGNFTSILAKITGGTVFISAITAGLETSKKIIIQRTATGIDANENQFARYSSRYGDAKSRITGISIPNLSQGIVWRRGYGFVPRHGIRMLNDWSAPQVGKNSGTIGFNETVIGKNLTTRKLVEIHNKGLGKMPKRELMGVTSNEETKIVKVIEDVINNSIQ